MHRLNTDISFRRIEKFKQVWEQHILFFLQMVFQIFKRNADQVVQLVQFRMSLSMGISHLFYQFQKYRTIVSDAAVMYLEHIVNKQVDRPGSKRNTSFRNSAVVIYSADNSIYIYIGILARLIQGNLTMTAEIYSKLIEHTCRRKSFGYDISNIFLS